MRWQLIISLKLITNPITSVERIHFTSWTPPSLLNSIVLLGGKGDSPSAFTAEIVPGIVLLRRCQFFTIFSLQMEKALPYVTVDGMPVGFLTGKPL